MWGLNVSQYTYSGVCSMSLVLRASWTWGADVYMAASVSSIYEKAGSSVTESSPAGFWESFILFSKHAARCSPISLWNLSSISIGGLSLLSSAGLVSFYLLSVESVKRSLICDNSILRLTPFWGVSGLLSWLVSRFRRLDGISSIPLILFSVW